MHVSRFNLFIIVQPKLLKRTSPLTWFCMAVAVSALTPPTMTNQEQKETEMIWKPLHYFCHMCTINTKCIFILLITQLMSMPVNHRTPFLKGRWFSFTLWLYLHSALSSQFYLLYDRLPSSANSVSLNTPAVESSPHFPNSICILLEY